MSELKEFATVRGTADQLTKIIRQGSGGYHSEIYLRVVGSQGKVETLAQTNARSVMSYCTFDGFDVVTGSAEAILPTGLSSSSKGVLDYLSIAEGSGKMEMRLLGEEPADPDAPHAYLASHWEAEGALNTRVRLPANDEDLQKVPWGLVDRWTSSNEYLNSSALDENGKVTVNNPAEFTPPTVVETTAATVNTEIIQPADFLDDVNSYPFAVEGGNCRLNLQGAEGDDSISGKINAERVEGPDAEREFDEGFDAVFSALSGPVRLSTAPSTPEGEPDPPLIVVQDTKASEVIRHVLGPFGGA